MCVDLREKKYYIVYAGKTLVFIPKARICAALALKTHYCFKHLHPIQKMLACLLWKNDYKFDVMCSLYFNRVP